MSALSRRRRREFTQLHGCGWTVLTFRPWQRSRPIPLADPGPPAARPAGPVVFAVDECHEWWSAHRTDDTAGAA
jgi:hypothetical protein